MENEEAAKTAQPEDSSSPASEQGNPATPAVWKANLDQESRDLLSRTIEEKNPEKAKDLTYLFNINQNKKTMVRVNTASDLLDDITNQLVERFAKKPDEFSNQDLFQAVKVVQDLIDKSRKQIDGVSEQPLIQVNQQNNEITIGGPDELTREEKDHVKNAVMTILAGIGGRPSEPIDVDAVDVTDLRKGDDD